MAAGSGHATSKGGQSMSKQAIGYIQDGKVFLSTGFGSYEVKGVDKDGLVVCQAGDYTRSFCVDGQAERKLRAMLEEVNA